MTPKILILSDPFTPPAYTPRLRCLCDYLASIGWDIDVYTEKGEELTFEHAYPIHEIRVYRTHSQFEWAVKSIWSLLTDWRNRFFSRQVQKAITGKKYDLVLCCTFSTFPLRAALDIAQERQIPLHVDLRDIDEQVPGAQYQSHRQWWVRPFRNWYRNVNITRRNNVIRKAQMLTCVSPWHQEFLKQLNPNISLVYNGFDEQIFFPKDITTDTFVISYVGRLYEQKMQDPTLLMEALQELDLPVKVRWYTSKAGQKQIQQIAQRYKVSRYMEYYDYVPPQEVPELLHASAILLVLTNRASISGAHGIMTTKFFEAMGVEKPVLCVRSDEECLAQVIEETHAGLAGTNAQEVARFIRNQYDEWKTKGFTRQSVNQEQKKLFKRQYQAQQMAQILTDVIHG